MLCKMLVEIEDVFIICFSEAEAEKFSIGFLEGPFRIGMPFQIPLEFHDAYGHLTVPDSNLKPELEARYFNSFTTSVVLSNLD